MCGIAALYSYSKVSEKLLHCLKNLEYRGYDSCGISSLAKNEIRLRKNTGDVAHVDQLERFQELEGNIGIAHTRWATHGKVSKENSHPHLSNDGHFSVVHNGIISNYKQLRDELEKEGFEFKSQTDTEIFVNLVQKHYSGDVEEAFLAAIDDIEGSYAIVLLSDYTPEKLYAVKKESPMILGVLDKELYITSDINAFISETRDAILIEDNEYIVSDKEQFVIRDVKKKVEKQKQIFKIDWDQETSRKGGFSHFMIKEIFDQPQTITNVLQITEEDLKPAVEGLSKAKNAYLVGVGTTFFVGMVGSYLFSKFADTYVSAISADEFALLTHPSKGDHALFLSQSGETYDTKMAVQFAKKNQCGTSAIVNVVGSSISQQVEHCIYQSSGPEICVVSTKAALAQMIILYRIALLLGFKKKVINQEEYQKHLSNLKEFPKIIERVLNEESGLIRQLSSKTVQTHNWLFMGRGLYYPIAMEAALKMKEVTYLHAEGLPAGFLKHGTLAMVDQEMYSLFFLPNQTEKELYEQTLSAIEEVKARDGKVIGFCSRSDQRAKELLDSCIFMPEISEEMTPFLELILAQLFSYYSALHLNRNIDKPRNLAKSVTVG